MRAGSHMNLTSEQLNYVKLQSLCLDCDRWVVACHFSFGSLINLGSIVCFTSSLDVF